MEDRRKSSPSSEASSSESESQDVLDTSSAKQFVRWMEGVNHELADLRSATDANARKGLFREQVLADVVKKNTAALNEHDRHIANSLKLNREVVNSGRQVLDEVADDLREESKRFATQKPEPDEAITATHLKIRWSTLAKNAPFIVKIAGVIAIAAGAVWAVVARLAKYIPGLHH